MKNAFLAGWKKALLRNTVVKQKHGCIASCPILQMWTVAFCCRRDGNKDKRVNRLQTGACNCKRWFAPIEKRPLFVRWWFDQNEFEGTWPCLLLTTLVPFHGYSWTQYSLRVLPNVVFPIHDRLRDLKVPWSFQYFLNLACTKFCLPLYSITCYAVLTYIWCTVFYVRLLC